MKHPYYAKLARTHLRNSASHFASARRWKARGETYRAGVAIVNAKDELNRAEHFARLPKLGY